MTFVVSERESRAGLKRAFPKAQAEKSAPVVRRPAPSNEQLEFAQTVEAKLGYSALRQRTEQRQRDEAVTQTQVALTRHVVLEALRSIGAPAPLTDSSVNRYKRKQEAKNYALNMARIMVDVALVVGLFGPVFAIRDCLRDDNSRRWDSDPATKASAMFVGLILGVVSWGFGALLFTAVTRGILGAGPWALALPWVQLLLASLASGVPFRASARLGGWSVKKSFLDRQWREWNTQPLWEYSSSVPERVLENALFLKEALADRGLEVRFDVEEFSLVSSKRWLVDPFLILQCGDERLYIDWWDEKEFAPEYVN